MHISTKSLLVKWIVSIILWKDGIEVYRCQPTLSDADDLFVKAEDLLDATLPSARSPYGGQLLTMAVT